MVLAASFDRTSQPLTTPHRGRASDTLLFHVLKPLFGQQKRCGSALGIFNDDMRDVNVFLGWIFMICLI